VRVQDVYVEKKVENKLGVDVGENTKCDGIRDEVASTLGSEMICIVPSVTRTLTLQLCCDYVRKSNKLLVCSYVLARDRVRQTKCVVAFEHA